MSAPLTDAQAKTALLRPADLPTGWIATPVPLNDSAPVTSPASCGRLLQSLRNGPVHGRATVAYQLGQTGPQLQERIVSFADQAAPRLQALSTVLTQCPRFSATANGQTSTMSLKALAFPKLGDRSIALLATVVLDGQPVTVESVYVAIGHNGVSFVNTSLHGPLPSADLVSIATKGVARLGPA
jgi:hypothetical protein